MPKQEKLEVRSSESGVYAKEEIYSFHLPPQEFTITNSTTWIMKISVETGEIKLNPEVPQEQAVHDFMKAINSVARIYDV